MIEAEHELRRIVQSGLKEDKNENRNNLPHITEEQ